MKNFSTFFLLILNDEIYNRVDYTDWYADYKEIVERKNGAGADLTIKGSSKK